MPDADKVPKLNDERAERIRRQQGPLDNETSAVLTRVYLARRLEYQLEYYKAKEREFTESSDVAFRAGAIIMTITSLLAALGVSGDAPQSLRLLTAILPASAALVASFRSLYQWDRQAQLFKDTALGLERAKLVLPDMDQVDTRTAANIFPELVAKTELVFEDEVNQWGQIAIGDEDKDKESDENIAAFAKEYGLDMFDAEGNLDPEKLGAFRDILAVSQSRTNPALSIDYPAMEAGAETSNPSETYTALSDEIPDAEIEHEMNDDRVHAGDAVAGHMSGELDGDITDGESDFSMDDLQTSDPADVMITEDDFPDEPVADLSDYVVPVDHDEPIADLSDYVIPVDDDDEPKG